MNYLDELKQRSIEQKIAAHTKAAAKLGQRCLCKLCDPFRRELSPFMQEAEETARIMNEAIRAHIADD